MLYGLCCAELSAARAAAESSVASLTQQLESIRSSQAVASEEAAMLRATLDKVGGAARGSFGGTGVRQQAAEVCAVLCCGVLVSSGASLDTVEAVCRSTALNGRVGAASRSSVCCAVLCCAVLVHSGARYTLKMPVAAAWEC